MLKPQKPRSVMELPIVEVVWIDAALSVDAGGTLNEAESVTSFGGLLECRDVGYLISLTKKEIRLAVSVSPEDNSFRHSNTIPRGWAKNITYLSKPEEKHGQADNQLHHPDKGPGDSQKPDKPAPR